nr:reverse transcriptase domain-containing protein [Tanacetum cinerariifolium]
MSTRSTSNDLVLPFSDPESVIRNHRRNLDDPSLLLDIEKINMANNNNNVQGPPPASLNIPAPDLHQDSLNSAAGGNFLTRNTQEALTIHENKSRVRILRNKPQASSASDSSFQNNAINTLSRQVDALSKQISSMNKPVNAIQEGCKTCGGPHPYYECQAAGGYTQDVYATTGNYNTSGNAYQAQGNRNLLSYHFNSFVRPPGFNQFNNQNQGNNQNYQNNQNKNTQNQNQNRFNQGSQNQGYNQNKAGPSVLYPHPSYSKEVKRDPKMITDQLLTNKEKLLELANTPLNENCSAVLLKKLPEKLGDTRRFLIPCEFQELESCMALADLGASINLMPLSVWMKLILLELTPTHMTLELATQTVAYPVGIAEDVFVKVGKFTFPVDIHEEELTLRVGDEKLVFNVKSTSKYPRKLDDESIHKIDILDITCEDLFHEVLNIQKSINPLSGSPTPSSDPVVASLSASLTPFGDNDFILKEINTFLDSDDSISPDIDDGIFDPEGDIHLIKQLLNNEISNDLPHHLLVFEINEKGTSKLPSIMAKDLKRKEKEHLLKVFKSYKRAIAWKISDIRGIDPNFCTHNILLEDDFKPVVQHQRSPWVSPIRVVPKKGSMTVITNEDNELIPTRMVTSWCICIDYRKLNAATRKDHFPLPFMDQMQERLAGNAFYCFLDGFSRYFQIPPKTRRKSPSPALMEHFLTEGCLSVFAMLLGLFKGVVRYKEFEELIQPFKDPEQVSQLDRKLLKTTGLDELKETDGEKDLEAHYTNAKAFGKALPRKEKDPGSFTLTCFIKNMCYKALDDLVASAKITLSVGNDIFFFKSNNPTSNIIKRVYALELRRDQVNDLMLNVEENKVIEEFRARNDARMVMAISVISISSDSFEDSMGTPAGRAI